MSRTVASLLRFWETRSPPQTKPVDASKDAPSHTVKPTTTATTAKTLYELMTPEMAEEEMQRRGKVLPTQYANASRRGAKRRHDNDSEEVDEKGQPLRRTEPRGDVDDDIPRLEDDHVERDLNTRELLLAEQARVDLETYGQDYLRCLQSTGI